MLIIEICLSAATLYAMLLLSDRHPVAPSLGILVNLFWVGMWIYTKQYGFLLIDVGILLIYIRALKKQFKGEW